MIFMNIVFSMFFIVHKIGFVMKHMSYMLITVSELPGPLMMVSAIVRLQRSIAVNHRSSHCEPICWDIAGNGLVGIGPWSMHEIASNG